jgi:Ca-activated chloride channel family protein
MRKKDTAVLTMPSTIGFKAETSILAKLKPFLYILRLAALSFLFIALSRPRNVSVSKKIKTNKGIDIVMAIDVSASMLARDLRPNRLEALKDVASEFIQGRPNDRIGIVLYAGESYTKTPITSDKSIVLGALNDVKFSEVLENGTAIGMGLATSVNRLKDSKALSKVIILLTDGVNNSGTIDPKLASELAVEYGIKTYTIGIGSNGMALSPIGIKSNGQFQYGNQKVEIDEDLLKQIATATGGQYFRATNNQKLEAIYEEINKLEKTEVEEFKFYNYKELFRSLVLAALGLIVVEVLLRFTIFRSFV